MAKSPEEQMADKVLDIVEHAIKHHDRVVTGIEIDVQESGEFPYRVQILDDVLPDAGVAFRAPLTVRQPEANPAERDTRRGGA